MKIVYNDLLEKVVQPKGLSAFSSKSTHISGM